MATKVQIKKLLLAVLLISSDLFPYTNKLTNGSDTNVTYFEIIKAKDLVLIFTTNYMACTLHQLGKDQHSWTCIWWSHPKSTCLVGYKGSQCVTCKLSIHSQSSSSLMRNFDGEWMARQGKNF